MLVAYGPGALTKKPTVGRFLAVLVLSAVLSYAGSASAQQDSDATQLTEEQVVAAALGEASFDALSEAAERRGQGKAARARTWANPRIAYGHEQLFGESSEDTVVLQQVLKLSGRYGLMADAAAVIMESERLALDARRLAHAAAIRAEFFRLVEAQERIAIFDEWLAVMRQVDVELGKRVAAGESAPYERLRVQKEIADIEAAAARERAHLEAQRALLAHLLELPAESAAGLQANAQLMPGPTPDDTALKAAVLARPDIAAADAQIRAAGLLDEAADGWWVPEPQIEAGYITAAAANARDHGFVAGVSLALPFVKQAKAQREEALAMKLEAEGEKEFTIHHVTAEVLALARQVRVLSEVASTYERDGIKTAEQVVETARLAYSAGELGILELIDGYRGLVQARLTIVEIAADARDSEIEMWRELAATDREVER